MKGFLKGAKSWGMIGAAALGVAFTGYLTNDTQIKHNPDKKLNPYEQVQPVNNPEYVAPLEELVYPTVDPAKVDSLRGRDRQLGEALQFAHYVVRAAKEHAVDSHMLYAMIIQESGGYPLAVSEVGAAGLMQLMKGTARDLEADPIIEGEKLSRGEYAAKLRRLIAENDSDYVKLAMMDARFGVGSVVKGAEFLRGNYDFVRRHTQEEISEEELLKHALRAYIMGRTGWLRAYREDPSMSTAVTANEYANNVMAHRDRALKTGDHIWGKIQRDEPADTTNSRFALEMTYNCEDCTARLYSTTVQPGESVSSLVNSFIEDHSYSYGDVGVWRGAMESGVFIPEERPGKIIHPGEEIFFQAVKK